MSNHISTALNQEAFKKPPTGKVTDNNIIENKYIESASSKPMNF
jgi:hypothetical protein